jgi:DNA replication and repair protein RecF
MHVSRVNLSNYRNYPSCDVQLQRGRNILVGENAQGKTNLLEAIELLATGRAVRAESDGDLIRWQSLRMSAELDFDSRQGEQTLKIAMVRGVAHTPTTASPASDGAGEAAAVLAAAASTASGAALKRIQKQIAVNGVTQKSVSDLLGRLVVVSFKSHDLNLLRGGPKYRRDWLDALILKLRPAFHEVFTNYKKSIAQRNRLLRHIFEKGKVLVSDQDQLLVWDKQVARYGARIIKTRLHVLSLLLPIAEDNQSQISRQKEALTIRYLFKASDTGDEQTFGFDDGSGEGVEDSSVQDDASVSTGPLNAAQLAAMEEIELAKTLMRLLKEKRYEEIRRKQTLVGPHRDDLVLCLNGADAVTFASQGQQRSIVLSLKLGELALIKDTLDETPVLLLDDVLAELDEFRQGLLMSVVEQGMQTIITTTHISGFAPHWLEGAVIYRVNDGNTIIETPATAPV